MSACIMESIIQFLVIPAPCSPTTKITTTQQLMVTHIQKCTPDGERMVSTITHTEQCTPSRTCTATPPGPTGNARETGQDQAKEVDNCSALAGGLGTLAALMVLGLVGMAIGWAWSYHRRREKSNDQERSGIATCTENGKMNIFV